jgi:hypothetical protein
MTGITEISGETVAAKNSAATAKRLAQIIAGLNFALLLSALVISIGFSANLVLDIIALVSIVYSVLAVLIISRQPYNTVGWLFLIVGFSSAAAPLGGVLQELEYLIKSDLVLNLGMWIGHLLWIPTFMLPITLVLQFFPDGRLLSRRWALVTIATLAGIFGLTASLAFHPWPWETQGIIDLNNPFGIEGSEGFFELLLNFSIIAFAIGLIGSLAAVVVRFWRSQGIERLQMKWLVYTAVVGISTLLLTPSDNPINDYIFVSLPIVLAVTISIAILRYRLFDIDIIIRRTLQYTILTAVLALIYFGLVVTFQGLFSAVGNQQGGIFVVISTLIIAALFNPLRIRIQNYIDRRFYRNKYHAEQALAKFAITARDEVDLDKLTIELLDIVQETIQPQSVGLVLFSDET